MNGLNSEAQTGSTDTNWYYFPDINKFLRHQLTRLPLWTPVMRTHFHSTQLTGISTDIESRFNVLKNNVFKNVQLPVRADVFVKKCIEEVNGIAKLNRMLIPHADINNNTQHTINKSRTEELSIETSFSIQTTSKNENNLVENAVEDVQVIFVGKIRSVYV